MKRALIAASSYFFLGFYSANAEISYKPINPSFGGNPLNSNHLNSAATAQKIFKETPKPGETPGERFVSMLQSRLYSGLASQVSDAIFGDDAQPSGTFVFDNQQVSFVNTGTEVQVTVTDFSTGQVTHIVIPVMQP
jgi:curli production assembly/transport component CsgF